MSTRRLAAIMFTDIQGYTALMQENESHAIILRDRHREVMERLHAKHNGKVVQYYGDGTLSIFDSCVEAVNCALGVQAELQQDPRVPLRIGIHLGDIVERADGVMGDGVNVAARVESLSIPGAILISQKVADEIKNQPDIPLKSLGTFTFKNVMAPMEVFSVDKEDLVVPDAKKLQGKFIKHQRPGAQSLIQRMPIWLRFVGGFLLFLLLGPLVYQPLLNLTARADTITVTDEFGNTLEGQRVSNEDMVRVQISSFDAQDPEQKVDWLAGGITYAIDKEWDADPFSFNQFAFMPEGTSLSERIKTAEDANVQYVITGNYAQSDSGYWVRTQVYEVATVQLKAEQEFRGADFFELMDEITVALKSDIGISPENQNQVKDLPLNQYTTTSLEAYQKFALAVSSQRNNSRRFKYYQEALEADSTFSVAHYSLAAMCHTFQVSPDKVKKHTGLAMKYRNRMSTLDQIRVRLLDYQVKEQDKQAGQLLEMMTELYPNKVWIRQDLYAHHYLNGAYEEALEAIAKYRSLSNDPGELLREEGILFMLLQRPKEGIKRFKQFLKNNAQRADIWIGLGELYAVNEDWDLAEQAFDKAALLDPDNSVPSRMLRHIAFMRDSAALITPEYLAACSGTYVSSIRNFSFSHTVVGNTLTFIAKNQGASMMFPIGQDTFIMNRYGYSEVLKRDSLGEIKQSLIYEKASGWIPNFKEDQEVKEAITAFETGKDSIALTLLNEVYATRPQHFYLADLIKHLKYKQSEAYARDFKDLDAYVGTYVLRSNQYQVERKGEQLFFSSVSNFNFSEPTSLYAIEKDRFVSLNIKTFYYAFERERGKISALSLGMRGRGILGTAKKE